MQGAGRIQEEGGETEDVGCVVNGSLVTSPSPACLPACPLCLDQSEVDQVGALLKGRGNFKVARGFGGCALPKSARRPASEDGGRKVR